MESQRSLKMKKETNFKSKLEKKWIILIVLISVSLVLSVTILTPLFVIKQKLATQVTQTLKEAYSNVDSGYMEKAKQNLDKNLSVFSGPQTLWIEVLRLVELLARETEDNDYYLKWAKKAHADKKSPNLAIIYADALCKAGEYKKAFNVVKNLNTAEAKAIKAYSLKRTGNASAKDIAFIDSEYSVFFKLSEITTSEEYIGLDKRFNRDEFKKNAAVLMMAEANLKDAYNLSKNKLWERYPLMHAYISYDNYEFNDALTSLDYFFSKNPSTEDLLLFQNDILIKIGENEKAIDFYYNFIEENPEYSFIPYNNVSLLEKNNISDNSRLDILKKGHKYFSNNVDLVLSLSDLYVKKNDVDQALEVLKEYLRLYPDDVEAKLKYNFLSEKETVEKFIGILWQLRYDNPDNQRVLQMLAWYLLGIYDFVELEIVLETAEETFGYLPWIKLYYGILDAQKGDTFSAYDNFLSSVKYQKCWEGYYNAALISYTQANYPAVIENLEEAFRLVTNENLAESNFYWLMAEVENSKENYTKAKDFLILSLGKNPQNLKAQLRLKTVDNILKGY